MRSRIILSLALGLLLYPSLPGGAEEGAPAAQGPDIYANPDEAERALASKEMKVVTLQGTIMVQRPKSGKTFALQTGSTVKKGDTLKVFDQSWVILKTQHGDRIGLAGEGSTSIDDFYDRGPDRLLRLVVQNGNVLVKSEHVDSHQSYFEINMGSVVASLGYSKAIFHYDSHHLQVKIQYLTGEVKVVDKNDEQKLKTEHTENTWNDGQIVQEEFTPLDELDVINFERFFNGDPPLERSEDAIFLNSR